VRQTALFVAANTFVSIVRALMNVTLCACSAFRTKAKKGKCSTDWCAWIGPDMGISAVGIGAITTQEMQASWHSFGDSIMGEITVGPCLTLACEQKISADRHPFMIMLITAERPFQTSTYREVSN